MALPDEHMNGPIWCYGVIYYHIVPLAEDMKLEVKQEPRVIGNLKDFITCIRVKQCDLKDKILGV